MSNGNQRGLRIYQRYCPGAILSGFLALALVGVFVAGAFLPLFVYAGNGIEPVFITGVDFVVYSFRDSLFKTVYLQNPKLLMFDSLLGAYSQPNGFYQFIGQYHGILEMVLSGTLMVAVIFTIVVLVFGLIYLTAGRNRNNITVSALSSSTLFFLTLFFGLGFLYFFLCHNMMLEMGASQWVMFHYVPFILIGATLLIVIALSIVYHISFKGKRFAGAVNNVRRDDFQPKHLFDQYNEDPTNLPYGIQEIGEEAFAMNTALRAAHIPDGIYTLGAGAFSNCLNLEVVTIPITVMEIGRNCFYNTPNLRQIIYQGTMEDWEQVYKGDNWIALSGVMVIDTLNGRYTVGDYYENPQQ